MIDKKIIREQLKNVLAGTEFQNWGQKLSGKVRDIYDLGEKMLFITTDRQSAFDRVIALIPFKGEVLTLASAFWFEETRSILPNHFLGCPDPNVIIGKKLKIFPIEFVVRGYLTGVTSTSVWTAYKEGIRDFCGNRLPEGMKKNEPFNTPIVTPTTKSEIHDEKITPEEIISKNFMSEENWEACKNYALKIFSHSQKLLASRGLILVDTKYEFGYDVEGRIYLCDEVHTPDSSRFWIQDTYEKKLQAGEEPDSIDKEFLRLWFKDNCDPYADKKLPFAPEDLVVELASRYIQAYEMITGKEFVYRSEPITERIEDNLRKSLSI